MEESNAYSFGYELGFWIGKNEVLAAFIAICFLSLLVYIVLKQIRNFEK